MCDYCAAKCWWLQRFGFEQVAMESKSRSARVAASIHESRNAERRSFLDPWLIERRSTYRMPASRRDHLLSMLNVIELYYITVYYN